MSGTQAKGRLQRVSSVLQQGEGESGGNRVDDSSSQSPVSSVLTPSAMAAYDAMARWLFDSSVGLTLVSGPGGAGKTRFLSNFIEHFCTVSHVRDGAVIQVQPIFASGETLQTITTADGLAAYIDLLVQQALSQFDPGDDLVSHPHVVSGDDAAVRRDAVTRSATSFSDTKLSGVNFPGANFSGVNFPQSSLLNAKIDHRFMLVIDDAAQLPMDTLGLLVFSSLMQRPQVSLTILADRPMLLAKVRAHLAPVQYLRRQLRVLDVPAQNAAPEQVTPPSFKLEAFAENDDCFTVQSETVEIEATACIVPRKEGRVVRRGLWVWRLILGSLLLGFVFSVWLLLGQMGLIKSNIVLGVDIDLKSLHRFISADRLMDAGGIFSRDAERDARQSALFKSVFPPAIFTGSFQLQHGFDFRVPQEAGKSIGLPRDITPFAAKGPLESDALSAPDKEESAYDIFRGDSPAESFSNYDFPAAIKRLFEWPPAHYVVQIDSDTDLARLRWRQPRGVQDLHGQKSMARSPLILPAIHRGRTVWVMVLGPYTQDQYGESLQYLGDGTGGLRSQYWVRRVKDLQQSVFRLPRMRVEQKIHSRRA